MKAQNYLLDFYSLGKKNHKPCNINPFLGKQYEIWF
jgi:hypothetical protein